MLSKNEIKYIQSLTGKKERSQSGCFLAEGTKIIAEFVKEAPALIQQIFATAAWINIHKAALPTSIRLTEIKELELEKISQLQTPQQALAVVSIPPTHFEGIPKNTWCLLLNDLQDPGNLGTIIRTADWFGIKNIFCTPETVDAYNPKVVQATMGSLLRTQLYYTPADALLSNFKGPVYGASLAGENVLKTTALSPGILVIGNEGSGIRDAVKPFINKHLSIPGAGHAESLNAGVAAGIFMALLH